MRGWWWALIVGGALAAAGAGAAYAIFVAPTSTIPSVTGLSRNKAAAKIEAAGFKARFELEYRRDKVQGKAFKQKPAAGTRLRRGEVVRVWLSRGAGKEKRTDDPDDVLETRPAVPPVDSVAPARGEAEVVCIDPGHQARANLDQEPNAPGSSVMKEKVRGGSTGVTTRVPEHEVVLAIALKLKSRLAEAGVKVVMTRETGDVNITNIERARSANEAGADLFVRVHADGNANASVRGISTLHPSPGGPTAPIYAESLRAARLVQSNLIKTTGARDRGLSERSDITGFNWAEVPSILPELGFLSNPDDDRQLNDPAYQDKLVEGLYLGMMEFLAD